MPYIDGFLYQESIVVVKFLQKTEKNARKNAKLAKLNRTFITF
jgi:hypothetical protein